MYFRKGTWCGNFKDGQPNGEGIFTPSDGRKSIKGKWNDGVLLQKL